MHDAQTTKRLIAQVLAGQLDAFGLLVAEQQTGVRAYFAARLDDWHEAEDLSQEVFVIAFRQLASFDPSRPLSAWLRGIAANLWRNRLRQRREQPREPGGLAEILEENVARFEGEHGAGELLGALRKCLEHLDGRSRELLERRYVQGLILSELSAQMQRQHSALTMSLHRIRMRLKSCIESRLATAGGGAP